MSNRASIIAVTYVILISVGFSILFGLFANSNEAEAAPAPNPVVQCQIVAGAPTKVVCTAAGVVVLNTTVNAPTVTLPPLPAVTIGPIRIPGPTVTETATVTSPPRNTTETETVTIEPEPETVTETVTVEPEPERLPGPTVTVPGEPGQATTEYVRVEPDTDVSPPDTSILPGVPDGPVEKTLIGGLSLIVLLAIVLGALYAGYIMGYKDSDKDNVSFLRSLRDNIMTRNSS